MTSKILRRITDGLKISCAVDSSALDDLKTTENRRRIIRQKGFLKKLYNDFYGEFANAVSPLGNKRLVELGSGGGYLKEVIPTVVTSDILPVSGLNLCFSASAMPFKNNTIDVFFMLNVFHHMKDSLEFLREIERCLKINGKVVMIEPANSAWGRFIYQNFQVKI